MSRLAEDMAAVETRIPKQTLENWKDELSDWMHPSAFRERINHNCHSIPRRVFFRQAGLTFLRDAWIAGRVADALPSDFVRLAPTERPDFEIKIGGQVQQFEATEADMEERRRGDEPDSLEPEEDPVEDWRARFEAIPSALSRVVTKKLAKDYPAGVDLVIYINLGCYGAYTACSGTSPAKNKFKRVFAMWEGILYKFWDDGRFRFEKWQYSNPDDF
jgi:hypothetical protein